MYLKGIKRKDVLFILECLKWNQYFYNQKQEHEVYHKKETSDRMTDVQVRLKEAINK